MTAILVWPLFLGLLLREAPWRAAGAVALVFLGHSVPVILFSSWDGGATAAAIPGGAEYWGRQLQWIRSGWDPEYDPAAWIPGHAQMVGGVFAFSLSSLGLVPFIEGLHQVDLMNFYCGQLLAHSKSAGAAVFYGWHLWSVCRGVGLLLLTLEASALAIAWLRGRPAGSGRGRALRWSLGAFFVLADGVFKYLLLEPVRDRLWANLG